MRPGISEFGSPPRLWEVAQRPGCIEQKQSSVSNLGNTLGRAGHDVGPGTLEKDCFRFSEFRIFFYIREETVEVVYDILELPNVPLVQHCLISPFLNLYTSF